MATLKCKMCGGNLELLPDENVCECEFCGTRQTVPTADNDKKITLFDRANRLRMKSEFDKSASVYESIVNEFPEEAEAYWGLCLCKYGIEYVDDPSSGKKVPTCHRTSFDGIFKDTNFELAQEYSDGITRSMYREEAKEIDRLQKAILEIAQKEAPFDIFICYKETDENGNRTKDSVRAQEIYNELTKEGYKVFFSRITLEDKLGEAYEPYIFSALHSSKIMLAIGTSYDNYNAVWVKNEWSRFLQMMKEDPSKKLIPCYSDIDAYDMPDEFSNLQGQDMAKIGFLQDLLRGIGKILRPESDTGVVVTGVKSVDNKANLETLLKRVLIFLEDRNFPEANDYCEKVLDLDPENAKAYLGKLMAEYKVQKQADLKNCFKALDCNKNYFKAIRYANPSLKAELEDYNSTIIQRQKNIMDAVITSFKEVFRKPGEEMGIEKHSDISFEEACKYFNNDEAIKAKATGMFPILTLLNCKPGDSFLFGFYSNTCRIDYQPITWQVFEKTKDSIFVISKNVIECTPFCKGNAGDWGSSYIRKWLNEYFVERAFNNQERVLIRPVVIPLQARNSVVDKVSLLSMEEMNTYFATLDSRIGVPTEYARWQGAFTIKVSRGKRGCGWWLRTTFGEGKAAYVAYNGTIREGSLGTRFGIRPVLQLGL